LLKIIVRTLPLLTLLGLSCVKQASAQGVSPYFGLGSAWDSAATTPGCPSHQIADPFNGNTCAPAQTMGGVFGVLGVDFMLTPHVGFNGEYTFRFAQQGYLPSEGLNIRPAFYDFNAVIQPFSGEKRVVPVIEGGIGGAKMSFYASQSTGSFFNQSLFIASSNHFQVHGAFGVKLYVKSDIFIKPQFDVHYVNNLTDQYGRNTVPEFTISIGYTFGRP
jgi:hypothetical protein